MTMKKYGYPTILLLAITLIAPLLLSACGKSVGETIDDATITASVKTSLLNDPQVGGLRIDVDTFKGVVTLSGAREVPSRARQGDCPRAPGQGRQGRQVDAAINAVRRS